MKRPLKPDELRVWSHVASTVHPLPGRAVPKPPAAAPSAEAIPAADQALTPPKAKGPAPRPPRPAAAVKPPPQAIEPRRQYRISRERDEIGGRIDLHGMTQDRARSALEAFLLRAWGEGARAVLVITGKGVSGDGVLRKRTPEWLASPPLREIVAGVSEAHQRHGGAGALYVALKRRPRG